MWFGEWIVVVFEWLMGFVFVVILVEMLFVGICVFVY